jgi:acyl-coenzyme A thioesterase PaaI-like protein
MTELYKAFEGHPDYKCFGCSPNNPIGLNISFFEEDEFVIGKWKVDPNFQGFINLLHGGIQTTLLDEVASWCVHIKLGSAGVTQSLTVNFHHKVFTTQEFIHIKAKVVSQEKNIAKIEAQLFNSDHELCSTGYFDFFVFPERIAKAKFSYPGKEAYYKPSQYLTK